LHRLLVAGHFSTLFLHDRSIYLSIRRFIHLSFVALSIFFVLDRKLEHDRTIVSMPLKAEKEILKQIQKLERTKLQIVDFYAYNKMVQEKKVRCIRIRSNRCVQDALDRQTDTQEWAPVLWS
jgi:hypothetical protein